MTWRSVPLRRLVSATGGTWGTEPEAGEVVAPCIRGTDFDMVNLVSNVHSAPLRGFSHHEYLARQVGAGDLLIEKSGGGATQPVGRVVLHSSDVPAVPTNFAARLRPGIDLAGRFGVYLFSSLYADGRTLAVVHQTTGIQNLDLNALLGYRVDVPAPAEQRAIADFLDTETARIDALIAKKQALRDAVVLRQRATEVEEILRGANPFAEVADLPDGWGWAQLGVLVELHRGHDLPSDERRPGPVPIISSGGPSGWHDTSAVTGPGVVTGRYGTVGTAYYVEGDYWPLNTTLYVSDFRGQHPRWVLYLLNVLPLNFDEEKSAVTGINRNVVGKLRAPVPPVGEQRAITDRLDRAGQLATATVERLDAQVELLREHRQALITAAVTGQMDVPGVAA